MQCEDYPCCGHDICPDFDGNGVQLNMRCTCGATVPLDSTSSLCSSCLSSIRLQDRHCDCMDEDCGYCS